MVSRWAHLYQVVSRFATHGICHVSSVSIDDNGQGILVTINDSSLKTFTAHTVLPGAKPEHRRGCQPGKAIAPYLSSGRCE